MDSKDIVKIQTELCKNVRHMVYDICVKAVKDNTGLPIVFTHNLHYCTYYADMLKVRCFEKVIDNAKNLEK
jgi:hypothetical protein